MTTPPADTWDEPAGAVTPRGWYRHDGTCVGFYLDYGPDYHRSPHESVQYPGGRMITWCKPTDLCGQCQPGHILVCAYPNGPGTKPHRSRWFATVEQAKRWVEIGGRDRVTATVEIYGDAMDLSGPISDTSAVVHAFHIVAPHPLPVESGPVNDGDGVAHGYRWTVEIREDTWWVPLYEQLCDVADKHRTEFTISADAGISHSYKAGDRAWFAEQQAMKGIQ